MLTVWATLGWAYNKEEAEKKCATVYQNNKGLENIRRKNRNCKTLAFFPGSDYASASCEPFSAKDREEILAREKDPDSIEALKNAAWHVP